LGLLLPASSGLLGLELVLVIAEMSLVPSVVGRFSTASIENEASAIAIVVILGQDIRFI
jgi:hypothetical protein